MLDALKKLLRPEEGKTVKSLDTILGDFNTVIDDLNLLANANKDEIEETTLQIVNLENLKNSLTKEKSRAEEVASKLKALIS